MWSSVWLVYCTFVMCNNEWKRCQNSQGCDLELDLLRAVQPMRQASETRLGQWGSQMFESGVHEKPDLPEAFYELRIRKFGREPGDLPSPRKRLNLGLTEMQFSTVLRGLLALFSLFLVDILSRSQLPTPTPRSLVICKFGQIKKPIFSQRVCTYPQTPWLR